jgi:transcriptional regulator with XRE-family HTH domain
VDPVRIGLSIRALRRRKRWTQQRLADKVGMSRSVVARVETGHGDRLTFRTLSTIVGGLGATISVRVLWHGEGLDRLLDASHADIADRVLRLLRDLEWYAEPEVSFNVRGERGMIDILAFHPASGSLLVIEIKSVVPDLQAMLGTLDRKVRLAGGLAVARGWRVREVSKILVLPDDRTARRRVERHGATFEAALPARTALVRRWLKAPIGRLAGILFLADVTQATSRHRIGRADPRS